VQAYDFVGMAWDTRGTIAGQGGTTNISQIISLLARHTGTSGADVGLVNIRFTTTGTNPVLNVDELLVEAINVGESVGYSDGRIWLAVGGTSGTVAFVNGVADNPVPTWAEALTLSASTGLTRFNLGAGFTATLSANSDAYNIKGIGATVALGGQSIEGAIFNGPSITGTGVATVTPPTFNACKIGAATIPPSNQSFCTYTSTMTLGSAGDYFINDFRSGVAGGSSPMIDYNNIGSSSTVNIRSISGGLDGINIAPTTVSSWEFTNGGTAQVTGTGGSVFVRGQISNTVNNSLGSVIMDITGVMNQTTNGVVRVGLAQGAGTGDNQIQLDSGASATDGAFDPSQIAIALGTGAGQTRLIFQYDGATKIATVDRDWKVNPDTTSTFLITTNPGREHVNEGLAQGGAASSITLNTLASSNDDAYVSQTVFIRAGTGEDQAAIVTAYNGTTKVATIFGTWAVTPDTTSAYAMLPSSMTISQYVSGNILADIVAISGSTDAADNLEHRQIKSLSG